MQYQNPRFPGRYVHSADMRELLGLPSSAKLPREGMPARYINGIKTWVEPLVGNAEPGRYGRLAKRSTHRVMCECPTCGDHMSAGRLFQHKCAT